jgi:hypothetical protein
MLSRKAANTKFYLDPTRVDSMIYHNWGSTQAEHLTITKNKNR